MCTPGLHDTYVGLKAEVVFGIGLVDWGHRDVSGSEQFGGSEHPPSSNFQNSPFFFWTRGSTPIILASG